MRGGVISGIRPGFPGLSRSPGQVTHVLLTRSPLIPRPKAGSSFDLHVLSTPPAFVLSQDQTLRKNLHGHPRPPRGKPEHTTGTKKKSRPNPAAGTHRGGHPQPIRPSKNNRYQQTWHTIEFSNNRSTRHQDNPQGAPIAPEQLFKLTRLAFGSPIGPVRTPWGAPESSGRGPWAARLPVQRGN